MLLLPFHQGDRAQAVKQNEDVRSGSVQQLCSGLLHPCVQADSLLGNPLLG